MTGPTYTCTAWGDPHYATFGGLVHHLYDKGLYEHARFTIPPCGCEVVIQTFLASLGVASAIAATAVRVGDTTFEITGGGDVTIRQPHGASSSRSLQDGGPEKAHFCNGGCTLERQNRASWRLHLPGGAGGRGDALAPVQIMSVFDTNGDGVLSIDEFSALLRACDGSIVAAKCDDIFLLVQARSEQLDEGVGDAILPAAFVLVAEECNLDTNPDD